MTSRDIRQAINSIQQNHGRLTLFAKKYQLSYNYLVNVGNVRLHQLGHDTALKIIAALKDEQRDEINALEQQLANLKAATNINQSAA